ncbi:MAG: tyrosine-type recombinase/integrase [Syntrophobacteraceae bacterium]
MRRRIVIQVERQSVSESRFGSLDPAQIERLTEAFHFWRDAAPTPYIRRVRGRYRLAFLFLRHTGARIGEVLSINDLTDIDYGDAHVHIAVLDEETDRQVLRSIPVPVELAREVLRYIDEFPMMRGRVFALDQGNFRREFYRRAEEAHIPRELSHPHILRHTRAIELLEAGVPLSMVRDLLGHALSSTTALYVRRTEITTTRMLKERGIL